MFSLLPHRLLIASALLPALAGLAVADPIEEEDPDAVAPPAPAPVVPRSAPTPKTSAPTDASPPPPPKGNAQPDTGDSAPPTNAPAPVEAPIADPAPEAPPAPAPPAPAPPPPPPAASVVAPAEAGASVSEVVERQSASDDAPPEKSSMRLGGLKGGANAGRFFGTLKDSGFNFGLTLGAFLHFEISDRFVFQPEFLLTDKGSNIDGINQTTKEALLFAEVPLLARMKIVQEGAITAYAIAGPSLAYLLDANIVPEEDRLTLEVAAHVGVGFELVLKNHDLHLELRAAQGLRNIVRDDSGKRARTSTLSLLTGITL